jgi:hypothetical protein
MASFSISHTDQEEAYLVGKMGIHALLGGENDNMITLVCQSEPAYQCTTGLAELAQVANAQRLMPDEYLNESKTVVTQAFYDYALPLIGEPLPDHVWLEKIRIQRNE